MQVTLEKTSELDRCLTISVPSGVLDDKVSERLQETRPRVRLNGFRPGKVPLREVRRRFGDGIRREVTEELIQTSYVEALEENELTPAGMPTITGVQNESGRDLVFTAEFEIYPEVSLKDFSAIQITRPATEITDQDMDAMVENLRVQRRTWRPVNRPCARGDQLTISFTGSIDEEEFPGNKAEDHELILGEGSLIPGFEEQLEGALPEANLDVRVTFPEDYQQKDLAGREAVFAVLISRVAEAELPEVDETFYASFGVSEGGEEAFRAEVKGNMQREVDRVISGKISSQVMQGLADLHEMTLPKSLVRAEMQSRQAEMMRRMGMDPARAPALDLPLEGPLHAEAERRVKLGLILREVIRSRELTVDEEKVRAKIELMAGTYEQPEEVVRWYYSNENELEQIQNTVLEEMVVDLVVAEARLEEETVSYQVLMNPGPPETGDAETPAEAAENP